MPRFNHNRIRAHNKIMYCQDKLDNITERMIYAMDLVTSQSRADYSDLKEDIKIQVQRLKDYFSDVDRIMTGVKEWLMPFQLL